VQAGEHIQIAIPSERIIVFPAATMPASALEG
jgi:hypothetical protein